MANWAGIEIRWIACFLLLGPLAIVAQYCNIQAFRAAPSSVIGPIRYTWIIYGALFGVLFFGEAFTLPMAAGISLILVGGALLARLRNRL